MKGTGVAMPEIPEEQKKSSRVLNRRVHMANERTFLAWIRTSLGIMAFGFVVEKFALFVRQISYYIERTGLPGGPKPPPSPGYSSAMGIFLVALGALVGLMAYIRYKNVERQIDEDTYHPSVLLNGMLIVSVLAIGIFLIFYLIHSIR
jgi:uncharacterized membrane protein YidH (DUF202 family)